MLKVIALDRWDHGHSVTKRIAESLKKHKT